MPIHPAIHDRYDESNDCLSLTDEYTPLADGNQRKEGKPEAATDTRASVVHLGGHTRTSADPEPESKPFSLDQFALNGQVEEMKKQMLEDKPVLGSWALAGQGTVLFSRYNTGKTVMTMKEVMNGINSGKFSGDQLYYINADDTYKGLVFKGELAEKHGFKMLAPGHNGFKTEHLHLHLRRLVATGQAKGIILILDTVKKFTDLMNKTSAAAFTEDIRQFVSHGGTVIMLAHVNKHKDAEGKSVHEGTADLVNDCDCAYIMDTLIEDAATGTRSIRLENIKQRGDVPHEVVYRYNYSEGQSYQNRLDSLVEVGKEEREEALKHKKLQVRLDSNLKAIEAIKDCIREGITQKTALIQEAHERSGLTKKKISKALLDHTGGKVDENHFWHVNIQDKNAHVYQLNYGVS